MPARSAGGHGRREKGRGLLASTPYPAVLGENKCGARGHPFQIGKLHTDLHTKLDARWTVCIFTHMDNRALIKALGTDGWFKVAQKGSHVQLKHPTKPGRVTVPHPRRDIPIGTLRSIEKQAGIKLR